MPPPRRDYAQAPAAQQASRNADHCRVGGGVDPGPPFFRFAEGLRPYTNHLWHDALFCISLRFHQVAPGEPMKSIQVDSHVLDYLKAHGMDEGQSASDVLRSLLLHTIEIDDELYVYLMSLASTPGETANSILRRELDIGEAPEQPPAVIEFHIPAGTGSNPWNTRDTAVQGVVGQTLRIHNDDNVPHRLHTSGAPFPHAASETLPGTFSDFVLAQPYGLDAMPGIYDHIYGQAARFWINVRAAT